ncbi:MAG: DNA-processing protein DprA, partial [Desulfovibrionaceae bacterium]|nr:DNA-processing protein DprA [Desulfovibrionaceae bacterium]
ILDPPHILYYQGNVDLLSQHGIAVIGTRKASSHGKSFASSISTSLVNYGFSIISGLAEGIDAIAHHSALESKGATIAVLGNGLDVIYPARNTKLYSRIANEGCLLTEFPPTTPPKAIHFPVRNRIVSGLSLGVVVIEAGIQSGTMITVKNALEQGRSVYAIPSYHLTEASTGNSHLLEEGAISITTAEEIFEDLVPQLLHGEKTPLLTQKLLEYQHSLNFPQKDYFTDMLHIFESSTPKALSPQKKQYKKNVPNPIPSPHIYNIVTPPTLYYGEHSESTPSEEFSSLTKDIETDTVYRNLKEAIYKSSTSHETQEERIQHHIQQNISPSHHEPKYDSYSMSALFTPILEQLFQEGDSIAITTQTKTRIKEDSDIPETTEDIPTLPYQSPLKEVLNNTVSYGLSTTAEIILDMLHTNRATPEDIVQHTSIDAKIVATELILLEVQGLIQKHAGGYYSIIYE